MPEGEPIWNDMDMDSPRAVLLGVAQEGVERLVIRHLLEEGSRIVEELRPLLPKPLWFALDSFLSASINEVVQVTVPLGAALALTPVGPLAPTFEGWLTAAIELAGLTDYRPRVSWEGEKT